MTQPDTLDEHYEERLRRPIITVPQSRLGRLLFGLGLALWFALLMLPCLFFFLATSGEITIWHNNIPDAAQHPALQVRLVMEIEQRGFQIIRSSLRPEGDTHLCIETSVSYLLWQRDETSRDTYYCDCYSRPNAEAQWTLAGANLSTCEAAP
jgi:hypothetical protein